VPSGHIQPQKNRPNIKVRTGTINASIIPGRIILSAIEIKNIKLGSILNKTAGFTPHPGGLAAVHRTYTKKKRKNVWLNLRNSMSFRIICPSRLRYTTLRAVYRFLNHIS
jgi:hypothetical protein